MRLSDIDQDTLMLKQGKTGKFLRIALTVDGARSQSGTLIDHLTRRTGRQTLSFCISAMPNGQPSHTPCCATGSMMHGQRPQQRKPTPSCPG